MSRQEEAIDAVTVLAGLTPDDRDYVMRRLTPAMRRELSERWIGGWARSGQAPPEGDWRIWLIRAGRGFGKTRAGAEWVTTLAADKDAAIALVGATEADVRRVMIDGPSGLRAVAKTGRIPRYTIHKGEVRWPNGAVAYVYSADAPEQLRGPEHSAAWCDELAKWRRGDAAWDNLMMGLRRGANPRVLVTTTPRPTNLMKRVLRSKGLVETRGTTRDNPFLPQVFVDHIEEAYAGTALGRQELDGEMVEDLAGALWSRALLETCRGGVPDDLVRVVVGVDPPAGGLEDGTAGDACGIVAVGLDGDGVAHVLGDASVSAVSPEGWARAVAGCAAQHRADRVVAEANQGGAMVRSVLMAADVTLPLTLVREPGEGGTGRAGGDALRTWPGAALRTVRRAGGRDVRAGGRGRLSGAGAVAGSRGCAGVGGERADAAAAGEGRRAGAVGRGVRISFRHPSARRDDEGSLVTVTLREIRHVVVRAEGAARGRAAGVVAWGRGRGLGGMAAQLRGAGARGLCGQCDRAAGGEAGRGKRGGCACGGECARHDGVAGGAIGRAGAAGGGGGAA